MDQIKLGLIFIRDLIKNIFAREPLVLISEAGWSIKDDCNNIKNHLKKQGLLRAGISITPLLLKNKIIHFASENMLVGKNGLKYKSKNNKLVLTWFHISENDTFRTKFIPDLNHKVEYVHTSSQNTKAKLVQHGLDPEKIVVIPLGVDLNIFRKASSQEKLELKTKLNLPQNKILIGSFQKDGNGWGEGLTPKLIKGPDIFCDVAENLAQKFPIHVVLTGPARGYVKKRLEASGISYTHKYVKYYYDTAEYFKVLDLYIVSSREEGGPKAILESMASGVPIISTRVGMVPEIIEDGVNGFLADSEDTIALTQKASLVLNDPNLKEQIVNQADKTIKNYEISNIIRQYYDKIYKNLLNL